MNPLLRYLVFINIATFIAFVIDFFLCMWKPEIDDTAANSLIMDVFPILGGAVGMMLALFVLGGLGRGHRMNKDNIAWWFLAIVCLIVWGLVVATKLKVVSLNTDASKLFTGWNLDRLMVLGIYLVGINIITFCAFAWDKHVAANGNDFSKRLPEAFLLGLAIIGGSIGGLLAMYIVRHKTRKWYFVLGLPLFSALHIATVIYMHAGGLI